MGQEGLQLGTDGTSENEDGVLGNFNDDLGGLGDFEGQMIAGTVRDEHEC